jgi:hypothetical protein
VDRFPVPVPVLPVPVPVFPLRPVFIDPVLPVPVPVFPVPVPVPVFILPEEYVFVFMLVVEPVVVFVVIVVFVFMFVFMFELRMFEFVLSLVQAIIAVAAMPKTALIRIFLINSPVYKAGKTSGLFPSQSIKILLAKVRPKPTAQRS